MTRAYIGLGSNLGDRRANLAAAVEALNWGDVAIVCRSSIYETTPVGAPAGSPDFLNQVVAVDTTLDVRAFWDRCSAVEAALGRSREHEARWGPRVIDLDLLLFGDLVLDELDLRVPHPRIAERAFVLIPLAEIAPDVYVPGTGAVAGLRAAVDEDGVRKA